VSAADLPRNAARIGDEASSAPGLTRVGHAQAHEALLHHQVLRVRIIDVDSGRLKVGLTLPVGLVGVATRMGARLVPAGLDTPDLLDAIERGELAEPVVIHDQHNGERIEIELEGLR